MKKIITLLTILLLSKFSFALTHPIADIVSVNPTYPNCNNGAIGLSNIRNQPEFFLDVFDVYLSKWNGSYYDTYDSRLNIPSLGAALFINLPAGDYQISIYFFSIFDNGSTTYPRMLASDNTCPVPTISSIVNASSYQCSNGSATMSNGDVFNGLSPGYNSLNGTYSCGCNVLPYTVTAYVGYNNPYPTVSSITNASSPLCSDGIVYVSNGDVFYGQSPGVHLLNGYYNPGCGYFDYNVFANVNSGPCNFDFSAIVTGTITNCSSGSILITTNNPACVSNYNISVYDNNSNVVYTNTITPGNLPFRITQSLLSGHYTVSMNANGANGGQCTATHEIDVPPPSVIFYQVAYTQKNVGTHGCNNGSVTVTPSNDSNTAYLSFWTEPYQSSYNYYLYDASWNLLNNGHSSTGFTFTGLAPGTYHVQTIGNRYDAQFCFVPKTKLMTITEPPCFTLTTSATALTGKYCNDGTLTASIDNYSNDCSPHIYVYDTANNIVMQWDPNTDGPCPVTFTNLPPQTYRVEAYGGTCADTAFVTIADGPCNFKASDFVITQVPGLHGCSNNKLLLKYTGAACGAYSFFYASSSSSINNGYFTYDSVNNDYETNAVLPADNYTISGQNGECTDAISFVVTDPPCTLALTALGSSNITCSGNVTGIVTNFCGNVQVSLKKKATGALVASVNSTDGSYIFNTLNNGNYTVTATDNSGCSASVNAAVSNAFCPVPTGLKFTKTTNTKGVVSWDAISCSLGYSLQYRQKYPTSVWVNYNLTSPSATSKQLKGLFPGTVYEYRVRTKCTSNSYSAYTAIDTFCTSCPSALPVSESAHDNKIAPQKDKDKGNEIMLKLYPNPARGLVYLSFSTPVEEKGSIIIYGADGKTVLMQNNQSLYNNLSIDIGNLSNGAYLVTVIVNDKRMTAKLIVEK